MKRLMILCTVVFLLLGICNQAGASPKDFAATYIKACQAKDTAKLFNINLYYRIMINDIVKNSPKFAIQDKVNELFNKEVGSIERMNKLYLFVPGMKWKLLEVKPLPPKAYKWAESGFHTNFGKMTRLYLEFTYDKNSVPDTKDGAALRRIVTYVDYAEKHNLYWGMGESAALNIMDGQTAYWGAPPPDPRLQSAPAPAPAPAPGIGVDDSETSNMNPQIIQEWVSATLGWYKESGLAELQRSSKSCYADIKARPSIGSLQVCAAIDYTTSLVDSSMIKTMKWPESALMPYFLIDNVNERIYEVFPKINITKEEDMDTISDLWFAEVEKDIEQEIKKLPPPKAR